MPNSIPEKANPEHTRLRQNDKSIELSFYDVRHYSTLVFIYIFRPEILTTMPRETKSKQLTVQKV